MYITKHVLNILWNQHILLSTCWQGRPCDCTELNANIQLLWWRER